ncbi:MAG TPA: peptide deformylase [Candidatus Krumholzibacteria bacterium]|nr:peptide deformylase [Candidatus Krumholzibacteria bacterium]
MELQLRYYGDPILRRQMPGVTVFDARLRAEAEAMLECMERESGVGLAAPQVALEKRLLVALQMGSPDDSDAAPIVMVNPEIVERSRETWVFEEGCLSIPGIRGDVTRPDRIEVRYQDLDGNPHSVTAEGMYARVLQHEIDHLDGRLFIDYLSAAQKILLKPRLKKIAERQAD